MKDQEQDTSVGSTAESVPRSQPAFSSLGILASKVISQPFTIIASLVVANYLGPDEKGLAALSRVLPTFIASLAGFGVASSLKHAIGRKDKTLADVGYTSLFLSLVQGLFAAAVFLTLIQAGILGELAIGFPQWVKLFGAAIIPLSLIRQTLSMGFAGHMDFRISNVLDLLAGILFAGLSAILVVACGFGFSGVFISYFASVLFATVLSAYIFVRKYQPTMHFDRPFVAFSFNYGIRAYLGTIAKRGNTTLDQFFLGILAPSRALGNYSVALSIANFLFLLPQSIAPVLVNVVAEMRGKSDPEKIAQIHRALMLMQFVAGIAIAASGYIFIPLLLPEYTDVPLLILLLLPGALFFSSFQILESVFVGSGKPGRASWCHVLALLWSLISYPILVPSFGGYGAAAACSLNFVAMYVMVVWLYRRSIGGEKHRLFSFSRSDVAWISGHFTGLWRRVASYRKQHQS